VFHHLGLYAFLEAIFSRNMPSLPYTTRTVWRIRTIACSRTRLFNYCPKTQKAVLEINTPADLLLAKSLLAQSVVKPWFKLKLQTLFRLGMVVPWLWLVVPAWLSLLTLHWKWQTNFYCVSAWAFPSSSNLPLIKPTAPQFNHFEGKLKLDWKSSSVKMKWRAGAHRYSRELPSSSGSSVVDVLQIPAFLCRQTDLLLAAAATGQLSMLKRSVPRSLGHEACCPQAGIRRNQAVLLTERGTSFGYNTLVVDFRSHPTARTRISSLWCYPQRANAGGQGDKSGGQRQFVPYL